MPGINEVPYLTNSSMMGVVFLPRHSSLSAAAISDFEFGEMYRRFGSQVTIIEMAPQLVRHEDEDVSAAIKDIVGREGVDVRLNAECVPRQARDEIVAKVDCTAGDGLGRALPHRQEILMQEVAEGVSSGRSSRPVPSPRRGRNRGICREHSTEFNYARIHERKWPTRKEKFMKILMVLTSHDKLGNTGRETGFWLEEFAAPYFTSRTPASRS